MTASRAGRRSHEWIDRSEPVVFSFNGGTVAGFAGDTIVSALVACGSLALGQSRRLQRRRGPLTADRFDPNCWLQVDDEANVAAAHRLVQQGVRVRSQHVWPALGLDLKSANQRLGQLLRPSETKDANGAGFLRPIYRQLMARVDVAGRLAAAQTTHAAVHLHPDVLVIGGGAAGLAAATSAASSGLETVLMEADHRVGGWVRLGPDRTLVEGLAAQAVAAGVVVLTNATVTGRTSDGRVLAVLERTGGDELAVIQPRQVIAACGLVERSLTFAGNDLPGVMLSTGARRLMGNWSVCPGERTLVLAGDGDGERLAEELADIGSHVVEVIDGRATALRRGLGGHHVEAVELGDRRRIEADLVVLAPGWTIDAGLLSALGAHISREGGRPTALGPPDVVAIVGALGGEGDLDQIVAHAQIVGRQAAAGAARAARAAASNAPGGPSVGRRAAPPAPVLNPVVGQTRPFALAGGVVDFAEDLTGPQLDDPEPAILRSQLLLAACAPGADARTAAELADLASRRTPTEGLSDGIFTRKVGGAAHFPVGLRLGSLASLHRNPVRRSALAEEHDRLGAVLEVVDGWLEPVDYGDPDDEREAVTERVAVRDTGASGVELLDGPEAGLLLAELTGLADRPEPLSIRIVGVRGYTCPLVVAALDANRYAIRTARADTATLVDAVANALHIDHREWLAVGEAVGESLAGIGVVGPEAASLVARALGVAPRPDAVTDLDGYGGWLWMAGSGGSTVIELRVKSSRASEVWRLLLAAGRGSRVRPVGRTVVADVVDLLDRTLTETVGAGR